MSTQDKHTVGALSAEAVAMLKWFSPVTYCINISKCPERDELVQAGLLEWVPAQAWSGTSTYGLTDAGRAAIAKAEAPSQEGEGG